MTAGILKESKPKINPPMINSQIRRNSTIIGIVNNTVIYFDHKIVDLL